MELGRVLLRNCLGQKIIFLSSGKFASPRVIAPLVGQYGTCSTILDTRKHRLPDYQKTYAPKCIQGKTTNYMTIRKSSDESYKDHSHVTLWTAERALAVALIPITAVAFVAPSAVMNNLLAFALTVHGHWGIEAIVADYVRPVLFGPVIPKVSIGLVYVLSALTLGGLFYFNYSDVGLVQAIKMLWKL